MMRIFWFVLGWSSVTLAVAAHAASADKDLPVFAEADTSTIDYKHRIGYYRGHAKVTQGTTVIIADTIITYMTPKNKLEKAVALGNLASYTTMPDNSKIPFNAVAKTINYYPQQNLVELIDQAKATQGNDNYAGPLIHYYTKDQVVISPPSKSGHTVIVIQPDQKLPA